MLREKRIKNDMRNMLNVHEYYQQVCKREIGDKTLTNFLRNGSTK